VAPLKKTPLHAWHVARGARMVDFAGWDMPVQYHSIVEEHLAVRAGLGLFDISHMGRLAFTGPGAADFLQRIFTNDVAGMKPGQIRYGLVCNEAGGILDDVLVYKLQPFWLMVVNASNRDKIIAWFEKQRGPFQMTMTDRTFDWAMIALQGPKAAAVMDRLAPGAGQLKYYFGLTHEGAGGMRMVSRTGYTGEDGFEIIGEPQSIVALAQALTAAEAGQRYGATATPCGLGARDTLRLEAAMPLYGHELSETIDPLQAGLGWAVKLDKDFIGKDAIVQRSADQRRPVRVGLELESKRAAREGYEILQDGKSVGKVTSGAFTPTLQKAIAMGYVAPAAASVGTVLTVDIRGQPAEARVVALPFYRRKP
jgi:aminomethyltransferase